MSNNTINRRIDRIRAALAAQNPGANSVLLEVDLSDKTDSELAHMVFAQLKSSVAIVEHGLFSESLRRGYRPLIITPDTEIDSGVDSDTIRFYADWVAGFDLDYIRSLAWFDIQTGDLERRISQLKDYFRQKEFFK